MFLSVGVLVVVKVVVETVCKEGQGHDGPMPEGRVRVGPLSDDRDGCCVVFCVRVDQCCEMRGGCVHGGAVALKLRLW